MTPRTAAYQAPPSMGFSRQEYCNQLPLLSLIYSEKATILKDTFTPVFIAETLRVARTWKQPRCPFICPPTDEWIKNLYVYVMEYYSAIKRNDFESVLESCMNLDPTE